METKLIIDDDIVFSGVKKIETKTSKTITIKGGKENLDLDLPQDIQDKLLNPSSNKPK